MHVNCPTPDWVITTPPADYAGAARLTPAGEPDRVDASFHGDVE
jgi:hypothetical protein